MTFFCWWCGLEVPHGVVPMQASLDKKHAEVWHMAVCSVECKNHAESYVDYNTAKKIRDERRLNISGDVG